MTVERPHFNAPFKVTKQGHIDVVEQDTPPERKACVLNIIECPVGFRLDSPEFGIKDPTFTTLPVDVEGLKEAIRRSEPRAELSVTAQAEGSDPTQQKVTVTIT